MLTRKMGWMLLGLLALSPVALAADDKKDQSPTDPAAGARARGERPRGTPDACQMDCSKTMAACSQACNPPKMDRDDPDLKDSKKLTQKKGSDSDKCMLKCGEKQIKCVGA